MNINWKVRIKNKNFWIALIPAVLLLAKSICEIFGVNLEIEGISAQLVSIVETLFVVLALLGIVQDPTTDGIADSQRALTYIKPYDDDNPEDAFAGEGK